MDFNFSIFFLYFRPVQAISSGLLSFAAMITGFGVTELCQGIIEHFSKDKIVSKCTKNIAF